VTIFHELYAMGPPWRSSFWLSPLQRYLALSLRDISDEVVTNRNLSRRWLVQGRPDMTNRMSVMPVFSTLGESTRIVPWAERAPQMVVGGRTGNAGRAYERCRDQLIDACRALEIVEIIDFGARQRLVPKRLGGVRISALGHLTPAEARAVVGNARAGFIDYPSDFLGKSTVFAAYAAHGLVPVVSHRRGEEEIGLKLGINYWVPLTGAPLPGSFEAIAANALTWYSGHSLGVQARTFGKLLHG